MKNTKRSKEVSNPYYAYGIRHISDNFKDFEASKGQRFKEYRKKWTEVIESF